jgi:Ca2+-transporting ATPase
MLSSNGTEADAVQEGWHSKTAADVARELATHPETGLDRGVEPARPEQRTRSRHPSQSAGRILWNQLKGGVIVVLLLATAVSLVLGHTGDSLAIAASIVFSVAFGFATDWRAEKALAALRTLSAPTARVIRGGIEHEIPSSELGRGDLVVLSAGQIVAADGRLVHASNLQIDESLLTGESAPVDKATEPLHAGAPLPDRACMAYAGTTVLGGRGRLIVTAPPADTELARIGKLVTEQEREQTPLERQAEQLGRRLALVAVLLSGVVTVLGVLRGRPLWLMLETGVILAIAAIPEGLPAVTTVALAVGVRRMARAHSLVRRLASVETLGCASLICTDKTGTLTENAMRVTRIVLPGREIEVTGSGYSPVGQFLEAGHPVDPAADPEIQRLLLVASVCNDARLEPHEGWHIHGSSTEGALLVLARKGGVEPAGLFEKLREVPFSSGRKRMAVVARDAAGQTWSFVKGSPEVILTHCARVSEGGAERPLAAPDSDRLLADAARLGEAGHRVLALALRRLPESAPPEAAEQSLTWAGLAAFIDPPRTGVKEAIEALGRAGIRTVMVTGDQKTTALAVARELKIAGSGDLCIDSAELAEYVRERRWEDLRRTAVFARVSPEDKLSIVRALKAAGEVVAMTGDGINDAPALKAADIGIAVGSRAADVAREASDLVVTTGDYGTLPDAVAEGRQVYANIRRAVHFLLLCSFSTIGVMLVAIVTNLPLPMSPLQLLWFNLVVHIFPAIALAVIPGEPDLLRRPPRDPREPLLTWRSTGWIGLRSSLVVGAAMWLFTAGSGARSQSLVMVTLSLALLSQAFAGLSEHRPFWKMTGSMRAPFWGALAGGLAIQVLAVHWPPLTEVLSMVPLSAADWLHALAASLLALAVVEAGKAITPAATPTVHGASNPRA